MGLMAVGIPAALGIRLGAIALTLAVARRAGAARWTALAGSALASLLTLAVALTVVVSGGPIDGVLAEQS